MNDTLPQVVFPLFVMGGVLSVILLVGIGIPYVLRLPLRRHVILRFGAEATPSEARAELWTYLRGFFERKQFEPGEAPDGALVLRRDADLFRLRITEDGADVRLSYEMEGMDSAEVESGKLSCVMGSSISFFGLQLQEAFAGLQLAEPPKWLTHVGDDASSAAPDPLSKGRAKVVRLSPWR